MYKYVSTISKRKRCLISGKQDVSLSKLSNCLECLLDNKLLFHKVITQNMA